MWSNVKKKYVLIKKMTTIPGNLSVSNNTLIMGYLEVQGQCVFKNHVTISNQNLYIIGDICCSKKIKVNMLAEYTTNSGISIDGLLIKDEKINLLDDKYLLNVGGINLITYNTLKLNMLNSDGSNSGSGIKNVSCGFGALKKFTSGSNNVAFGNNAGLNITTGNNCIAIGANSLKHNQTASNNIAIGSQSMLNTVASNNIAIGNLSGKNIANGSDNVILGSDCGVDLISGNENILIGSQAGEGISTASGNIVLGYSSKTDNHSNCIVFGNNCTTTADNQLVIGSVDNLITTTTSASTDPSGSAAPEKVSTYLQVKINDNIYKIPCYL